MKRFVAAQKSLLEWYEKDGRHALLWRNTQNLYHIYLSEIMLQQTQVSRVESEYYPKFLEKFPTLETLANATQEEVLAAWSGLGYYSRARNLHKTAKLCAPALPQTLPELLKLPGIGRYTASAICSFGLHQNVAVVDTNIARVIKRFFAILDASESQIYENAAAFVNAAKPREHNLALMDLGSLICTPKNPRCQICPLTSHCLGKSEPEIYTQSKKTSYESLELFCGVCILDGKIALKRSNQKLYKDMLILPDVEPLEEEFVGSFKHSYTKYRLTVNLYTKNEPPQESIWVSLDDMERLPISSLTKKALSHFTQLEA